MIVMEQSVISSVIGLIGVLTGAIITYIFNMKLTDKQFTLNKQKLLFEEELKILRNLKVNNLRLQSLISCEGKYIGKTQGFSEEGNITDFFLDIHNTDLKNKELVDSLLVFKVDTIYEVHKEVKKLCDAIYNATDDRAVLWDSVKKKVNFANEEIESIIRNIAD